MVLPGTEPACAAGGRAFIAEQWLETRIFRRRADVPAVHTEALAWRGETWRWMSAAAEASSDRVWPVIIIIITTILARISHACTQ